MSSGASVLSPAEAAGIVRAVDSIAVPLGPGVPGQFLHALATREDFTRLDIFGALLPDLYEVFVRPGVFYRSGFYGPAERFLVASGANVEFVPSDFRGFEPALEAIAPRIVSTAGTPPDADGWMSLSLHAGASVAELQRACADPDRICLVETSPEFPKTFGLPPEHRHALNIRDVDVVVEGNATPFALEDPPPSELETTIAQYAEAYIPDGATLQTGIGGIPNAIAGILADGSGSGFGIHSEMFTTGLMRLCEAGKVTNRQKTAFDGFSVTTFAAGTPELYDWLDDNDAVRFLPVGIVNSPTVISSNHNMITINGAMAVDLAGQVVADTISGQQFSGIGGHEDFIAAASLVLSDRSLICLPSTTTIDGQLVSRISPNLPTGSIVTTARHQVDVIITEYGTAELRGLTVGERAKALAAIGHPAFREELDAMAAVWP